MEWIQNSTTQSVDSRPILALTGTSSALSVLGSVGIFVSYYKDPEKCFTFRLLFYLSCADAVNAFGNFIGVIRNLAITEHYSPCDSDDVCIGQSFLTTSASLASFWWTFLAALNHFLHKRSSGSFHLETRRNQVISHFAGWGFPLLIAIIALSLGVLGEDYSASSGPWCWIKDCETIPLSPIFWMFLAGKFWEILAYIGTFAIYMLLKAERWNSLRMNNRLLPLSLDRQRQSYEAISSRGSSINQDSTIDDRFGLLWIFLYLYVTRVWGTIRFFIFVGHNGSPYLPVVNKVDKVLLYFQSVGDSAQGFVNFMGLILLPFLFRRCQ